jgi:hypothetical protein
MTTRGPSTATGFEKMPLQASSSFISDVPVFISLHRTSRYAIGVVTPAERPGGNSTTVVPWEALALLDLEKVLIYFY